MRAREPGTRLPAPSPPAPSSREPAPRLAGRPGIGRGTVFPGTFTFGAIFRIVAGALLAAGAFPPGPAASPHPSPGEPGTPPPSAAPEHRPRLRDLGISVGLLPPGPLNAITDVAGVKVGHVTLIRDREVRTGVTAVVPHGGNTFQEKVPAAVEVGNGFGKLAGSTQVRELGSLETPVLLTNTLSVGAVMEGTIRWILSLPGNERVRSVNAVVAETNDGRLNDIRAMAVRPEHAVEAIASASGGEVTEGSVGAGTGTVAFGFKGGIGTASRLLPPRLGGYTVGALAQTNFGGVLTIAGRPVGEELGTAPFGLGRPARSGEEPPAAADGSCVLVVATDAPLTSRNLGRLARRALAGMARTGAAGSHGSGDYAIAFSTAESVRIPHGAGAGEPPGTLALEVLPDDAVSPLFLAATEAAEEAILNSLFRATTMEGAGGRVVEALPLDRIRRLLETP